MKNIFCFSDWLELFLRVRVYGIAFQWVYRFSMYCTWNGLVGAFKDYFLFDYRCLFPLVLNLGYKNSLVHGFISDDGVFEGKIHVGNDEYFVESAKQYFKDAPQDFHSVIYESRDVHYPHAYGPGCGISEKSKRWMDKVKRYTVS